MSTTCDRFLDGRVVVNQPTDGFRAGIDAVLLAAAIGARPEHSLLELGCGAGTAMLCAASRLPHCHFTGLDIDPDMIDLAQQNIAANTMSDRVQAGIGNVSTPENLGAYDCVFFNPPFFDDAAALRAPKAGKQQAFLSGDTPLSAWIKAAHDSLKPKGQVFIIHRADALASILDALSKGFGEIAIKPVQPRQDKPAKRVLIAARKGSKAPLTLLPPLILHDDEGSKYSAEADAILRGRAGITMG